LESRNDGNKVFKMQSVSLALNGDAMKNVGSYIQTYFDDHSEVFVHLSISVDTKKTVAPLQIKPSKAEDVIVESGNKYKTLTKYTFYESGEKYVKVLLDFPDAKKLIQRNQIQTNFELRSFEILINDYKGECFKFAVPNLHHKICPEDCSFGFKSNNVVITLRKKKNEDNWWSLFKAKAVGEKPGDSV